MMGNLGERATLEIVINSGANHQIIMLLVGVTLQLEMLKSMLIVVHHHLFSAMTNPLSQWDKKNSFVGSIPVFSMISRPPDNDNLI